MHYKTIALEMLKDHPGLHEKLRASGTLLQAMETHALALKARHEAAMERLRGMRPESDPRQISSEALEIACQELAEALSCASSVSADAPTLDEVMAFLRRATPSA